MSDLTRREFAAMVVAATATPFSPFAPFKVRQPVGTPGRVPVQGLIDRIKGQIGVDWRTDTVDGLKAGDATTPVHGIATTSLATLAVLQQAVKAGANVIVTTEPAFYGKADARTPASALTGDPVYAAKNAFIDQHNLAIVRLNDHWRRRQPDPFVEGLSHALGWGDSPSATLEALVKTVQQKLGSRGGIRVIGDPKMAVKRVGLLPGSTPLAATVAMLSGVDVIVGGEMREWESVEFVRDNVIAGNKKGLVLVGRVVSEEPGIAACATWLKTVVPGMPVTHLTAGDPYWRPGR
jgi:putative NIF3 family GTP cyclohydrolase 1 type 2